eukprot:10754296-Ditylum_brightwellii.AAC.1
MLANVTANADPEEDYSVSDWTSPTVTAITATSKWLLCNIMGTAYIRYHAYAIATLPECKNGLGLFEPF